LDKQIVLLWVNTTFPESFSCLSDKLKGSLRVVRGEANCVSAGERGTSSSSEEVGHIHTRSKLQLLWFQGDWRYDAVPWVQVSTAFLTPAEVDSCDASVSTLFMSLLSLEGFCYMGKPSLQPVREICKMND